MPRAIAGSADDLKLLRAGLCPDCGASVRTGMTACAICGIGFGAHAAVLAPPNAPARAPMSPAPATASGPRALTNDDLFELERGQRARARFPSSFAEVPENALPVALGAAMSRAHVVMADAALVDDPQVLAAAHIPRARIHFASSSAALVDDAPPIARARAPMHAAPFDPDATQPQHDARAIAAAVVSARGSAQPLV